MSSSNPSVNTVVIGKAAKRSTLILEELQLGRTAFSLVLHKSRAFVEECEEKQCCRKKNKSSAW